MRINVDLILYNAVLYTVDEAFSLQNALAVKNRRIVAVGSDREILEKYESRHKVNASGQAVYPGFIDSHAHFYNYGRSLQEVGLAGTRSWEEVLQRVQDFAMHKEAAWLVCRGWNQNDWPVRHFPDNRRLNEIFPDTPVLLIRIDGHAAIANQAALVLAGIKPGDEVDGGEIAIRNGKCTGLLVDNAVDLVNGKIPDPTFQQKEKYLLDAQKACFAAGLTTVVDCGLSKRTIDFIDQMQKAGRLKMRLYIMASDEPFNYDYYLKTGPYKTDRLHVRAFKLFSDGALGSRGACLLEPYSDRPGWNGLLLKPPAYFEKIAEKLLDSDFQMCTHAIGDAANRMILRMYAKVLKGKNDRRWRIEHAQILHPGDIGLFGKYNVIPSVQPTHATSDRYWVEERLGTERLMTSYANKMLLKENGWLPLGTDFPVEDINPMKTFYAAVSRRDPSGYPSFEFQSQNALTREEALRGMTIWAAKANFEEREKGSIEPGKFADFVIMDQDIMKVDMENILEARPSATYIGGERVF